MTHSTPGALRPFTKVLAVTALSSALAVACGGADAGAPASKSPTESREPVREEVEPRTVEEAQEQIARLSASLDKSDVKKAEPATGDNTPKTETSKPSSATTPQAGATGGSEGACGNPCRALMSMKRAVDALCRMTGDTDNRCVDAKKTLTDSTTRVSPCKCPS